MRMNKEAPHKSASIPLLMVPRSKRINGWDDYLIEHFMIPAGHTVKKLQDALCKSFGYSSDELRDKIRKIVFNSAIITPTMAYHLCMVYDVPVGTFSGECPDIRWNDDTELRKKLLLPRI